MIKDPGPLQIKQKFGRRGAGNLSLKNSKSAMAKVLVVNSNESDWIYFQMKQFY